MFLGDDLLQAAAGQIFLPTMLAEELLKGSHGHAGRQGDRLDALSRQIGKLPVDVDGQMRPCVLASKTVVKAFQKTGKHRLQSTNRFGVHAWSSLAQRDTSFAILSKWGNIKLAL